MSEFFDKVVKANYQDPGLPEYACNPLISALPLIRDPATARDEMKLIPAIHEAERVIPSHIRKHAILRLGWQFFYPLPQHIVLEEKLSMMMRQGYIGRNPATGDFYKHLNNGYDRIMHKNFNLSPIRDVNNTASSMSIVSASGCGKSRTLRRTLAHYPPAIFHEAFGITQIPYLILECPRNGSLDDLCMSFFVAIDNLLGTDYKSQYGKKHGMSVWMRMLEMAQKCTLHAIGLLVIDEIQNLSAQKSHGEYSMLKFFVSLVNTVNVPVVLVGTPKAKKLFDTEFSMARRTTGMGNVVWDRIPQNKNWGELIDTLFEYQWVRKPCVATEEMKETLYELSQGIFDILIKLYVLSQCRAMVTRREELSEGLIRAVYNEEMTAVHPMLEAVRSGDWKKLAKYSDLEIPSIEERLTQIFAEEAIYQPVANSMAVIHDAGGESEKTKKILEIALQMGLERDIALPMIEQETKLNPDLDVMRMVHKLTSCLTGEMEVKKKVKKTTKKSDISHWGELERNDLRYVYFNKETMPIHEALKKQGTIVNFEDILRVG